MVASHKSPIVEKFSTQLTRSKSVAVAEYQGLTHKQMQGLRKSLRSQGAEMKIVKNTLARRACADAGMDALAPELKGPLAFVMSYDEPNLGPKAMLDFAKKYPKLVLKAGYAEGALLDQAGIKALGNLPTLPVLRGMFVMNLKGGPKKFLQLLQARVEQMGGAPPAEAAAGAPPAEAAPAAEAPAAEAPAAEATAPEAPAETPATEAPPAEDVPAA